jgi:hypothetical protein
MTIWSPRRARVEPVGFSAAFVMERLEEEGSALLDVVFFAAFLPVALLELAFVVMLFLAGTVRLPGVDGPHLTSLGAP